MPHAIHDRNLAAAFDGQAPKFERAPVQTDPAALAELVRRAGFAPGSRVIDCGCGPGLVARALLEAGVRVVGVDLSPGMIERARARCVGFGDQATFLVGSIDDDAVTALAPLDGAISRFVLHHIREPSRFVVRQAELVRPGGAVVLCDHTSDPDPERAEWHRRVEVARDHTHTNNLSPGAVVDLFVAAGLVDVSLSERTFDLDFDEWFDRGTPGVAKAECRALLLAGSAIGFVPSERADGGVSIAARHSTVRGVKAGGSGR